MKKLIILAALSISFSAMASQEAQISRMISNENKISVESDDSATDNTYIEITDTASADDSE